jgi:signal transduction histidine kinase
VNRSRSLNLVIALYVFFVMGAAGLLTSSFFVLLYAIGVLPRLPQPPILSPIIALLVSSVLGTSISALASERLLKPLNRLIRAMEIVSTGDFSVRVEALDDDSEIAHLLSGFNHMVAELGGIELFRDDFINNFSHEFKTPIVSIRGFAKQLQNEDLSAEKRKEYTDIIINEAERLSNMSANILLLTRLENQQIVKNLNEYELDEQIRNCVILLEKQWSGKNITMELDLDSVKVRRDDEMLSHLWINLLENAIKYSRAGGSIAIECVAAADSFEVRIRDDGDGMDAATMKRIFDKFYQGDASRATRGNGLGLSIVKRIVDLNGGTIAVESEPDRGTTFTVRLPRS